MTKEEERELSRTSRNLFDWVKVLKEPIEGEHPGPRLLNRRRGPVCQQSSVLVYLRISS